MPSSTIQEYLESIYKISLQGEVRPTQVAEALGVSGATVTATLRRLEAAGLITRPGGGVELTAAGRREAIQVVRRHRVAERFVVDVLGLPWEAAHEEACVLEHAMSDRVLEALERLLENPAVCPHGHPIPTVDGDIREVASRPLTELAVGESGVVSSVAEDDEDVLAYLASLGLFPGARVRVLESAPFGGPLMVSVDGSEHPLAREIAVSVSMEIAS